MDVDINTWNITLTQNNIDNYDIHSLLHSFFNIGTSLTYLLNTNQDKYSLIEKMIYDISIFHFKRMGIEYNKEDYFIEFFMVLKYESTCHVDTDEYDRHFNSKFNYENEPLLSCVTYLSESNIPTIITDIARNDYENDNYSEKNKIFLSFPKYLKQITFHGGKYYHGVSKVFENETCVNRYILAINLWKKKPVKVPYFDISTFHFMNYKRLKKEIIDVTLDNDSHLLNITKMEKFGRFLIENNQSLIHKSLFTEYFKIKNGQYCDLFYRFSNILSENNFENYELIELSNKIPLSAGMEIIEQKMEKEINNTDKPDLKKTDDPALKNMNVCENFIKKDIFTKQRMNEKSFFDNVTCDWIINSTEKYIMKKNKGSSFSKININSLKNIQPFVLFSLENLFKTKIVHFYNLNNDEEKFIIKNIHILKLDNNNAKIQQDIFDLTIKIILNDYLTISFKDGTKMVLNKGDIITHNNSNSMESILFNVKPSYMLVADIISCK
jgi:hypothetical protein